MTSPIPELASREALLAHLEAHGDLRGSVVEGIDLRECDLDWGGIGVAGAVFIACIFPAGDVALRLQARADCGVVFARGGAGIVQEVFQDAAINAYSPVEERAPMVFLGREFFASTGIWELVRSQAARADPPYDHLLTLTDDVAEAVAAIVAGRSAAGAERA